MDECGSSHGLKYVTCSRNTIIQCDKFNKFSYQAVLNDE